MDTNTHDETENDFTEDTEGPETRRPREFSVDGLSFSTRERELTSTQIMQIAGLDPATHYLTLVKDRHQTRLANDQLVKIRSGMTFVSASTEPTPTS